MPIENDARAEDAYIVGEVDDARGEYEKHFRLSDGSFVAAEYAFPVHYQRDGEWVDIDNMLSAEETAEGSSVYRASNGTQAHDFATTLTTGKAVSVSSGGSTFSMSVWDGRTAEEIAALLEVEQLEATEEAAPAETPETTSEDDMVADETEESADESNSADNSQPTETAQESQTDHQETEAIASEEETSDVSNESSDADAQAEEPSPEEVSDTAEVEPETSEEAPPVEDAVPSEKPVLDEEPPPSEEPIVSEEPAASEEADVEDALPIFNRDATAQILSDVVPMMASNDVHRSKTDVIPDTLYASVLYENVYPGVDLQYDTFSYNVKESIVLNEAPGMASTGENTTETANTSEGALVPEKYTFLLELTDLTPTLQEDGSISLTNGEGTMIYSIPTPYMMDSAGEYSNAVQYTLEQQENGYLLTVLPDINWLTAENLVYPVTIDPTILSKENESQFVGGTASENWSSSSISTTQMACGYHSNGPGLMEMYFKITELPTVPDGCTVVDAVVGLSMTDYTPNTTAMRK